jgi:hypothetical protein
MEVGSPGLGGKTVVSKISTVTTLLWTFAYALARNTAKHVRMREAEFYVTTGTIKYCPADFPQVKWYISGTHTIRTVPVQYSKLKQVNQPLSEFPSVIPNILVAPPLRTKISIISSGSKPVYFLATPVVT